MDLYFVYFILFCLGCSNLVKSNPLETLYLDVDISLIEGAAGGGGHSNTSYTFEGKESMDVLSSGMFGGVISSQPVNENALFFTYNHDKLYLQSYKVDSCSYFKLSPRVPGSVKTIFRGIFMVWESKDDEEFMYLVFTEPVNNELLMHLFVRKDNCFKRYVYNAYTKIFYYVQSSRTIYTTLPSTSSDECRADATAVSHSRLVPKVPSYPLPEKKLVLSIPESVRQRARLREKELMEKGRVRYVQQSDELKKANERARQEKAKVDQQIEKSTSVYERKPEPSTSYQRPQETTRSYQTEQEQSTSYNFDQERSGDSEQQRPTHPWFDEPIKMMHDPVLLEVIERHNRYKANCAQFMKRTQSIRRESRKGIPKKLDVKAIPPCDDNDDDTSSEGKLVIDDDPPTQSQEEKSDKEQKKEETKGKGKGKCKGQGRGYKKPGDDDKPDGGSGQGGAAAGGSWRRHSSGYKLRSSAGTKSKSGDSTGSKSSDRSGGSSGGGPSDRSGDDAGSKCSDKSGESSHDSDKHERKEEEARHGQQPQRGALITQTTLSDLNGPRIIGPGHPVNLEYVRRYHESMQFAAMYRPDSEYLNYPVDPHLLRNYPPSQNLEDCAEDADCHLQISDYEEDASSSLKQQLLSKDDRKVPDEGRELMEKAVENTESPVSEPQREPGPFEHNMASSNYDSDTASVIREIEKFIRPEWDQPQSNTTYTTGQGSTSTYAYSATQQPADSGESSRAIPESHPSYQMQHSYQSSHIFCTDEPNPPYPQQQSYQTQREQSVPESQQARSSHVLCIRGPKSKHPLVFPSFDTIYEEPEPQAAPEFTLHLESSNDSLPCKRPLLSYQTEAHQSSNYNIGPVPTNSGESHNATEPALGAVAAPMGILNQGVVMPTETPYEYPAPCFSPVSSEEGSAAIPELENTPLVAPVEPAPEPGPIAPAQQAEGGAAGAALVPENKGVKVKKKRRVRKTRVVRKTIYPQSFLPYYIAANTHGYMECEDMIPSLPILPLMPEPEDVVESYTETETDSDDPENRGKDAEDTDSADEGPSFVDSGRQIPDPRSPRPSRSRSSRRRHPEPPTEDDSPCTIS
ncbi:hypothetical protein MACJ_000296 [Theileria orientalis]|uniref:Uncharacterized protein n=1 Tax=Theileria orientalis TaxID=68886 RepID=A0A976QPQ6_THEOR|nr:hypothetical protein MACJ_000296 [Theileria orientalis]